MGEGHHAELRRLPAVHELAAALEQDGTPHRLAVAAARRAIAERREQLRSGSPETGAELAARAQELVDETSRPSLRRVVNASGVILHTGLGRAPLAEAARSAVARVSEGYANLELDLHSGRRGDRQAHVRSLLVSATAAEAAHVVGNGAGAVLLAVAALAGPGGDVIVSRGQLVEIGGGFRIPDVVAQSGARLVEVGTTNRTGLADYAAAVATCETERVVILRVHQSNFRAVGFVSEPSVEELCELGVPVIDDIGSGALLADHVPAMAGEPRLRASVAAGAALVCCSADKLLGGPQAGLLVGRDEAVRRVAAHPLARALRIDKLSLAALEATLALTSDPARALAEIPVLAMLTATPAALLARATALQDAIGPPAVIADAVARVGGGALPLLELPGPVVALDQVAPEPLAAALRRGDPPVIGRIEAGRVLLDPRTLADDEVVPAAAAVRAALADA